MTKEQIKKLTLEVSPGAHPEKATSYFIFRFPIIILAGRPKVQKWGVTWGGGRAQIRINIIHSRWDKHCVSDVQQTSERKTQCPWCAFTGFQSHRYSCVPLKIQLWNIHSLRHRWRCLYALTESGFLMHFSMKYIYGRSNFKMTKINKEVKMKLVHPNSGSFGRLRCNS